VGDAAVHQQQSMRDAYIGWANHISSTAQSLNATWPMVRIPDYELHAGQVRLQSGSEILGCSFVVESKDVDEYLKFVTANYEASVIEGHLTRYGNLDRLAPIGYTPNFTALTPDGLLLPDVVDRPQRLAFWHMSPRTLTKTLY
jgi:hypothetical protein